MYKKQIESKKTIESWYDRKSRNWITQVKDHEGNQIGDAHYNGTKSGKQYSEKMLKKEHQIDEQSPTNNAGNGQIAGIGIGSQGEPAVDKKKKRKSFMQFIKRNK